MQALQKIAIISNASKEGAEDAGLHLKTLAEKHGLEVVITEEVFHPRWIPEGNGCLFCNGEMEPY